MSVFFKKKVQLNFLLLVSSFAFSGCMTSTRQDELKDSINVLDTKIRQIQSQLKNREQQIVSTTQTVISSQDNLQNLQSQLQLTQGNVDELKARLKHIEENAGNNTVPNEKPVAPPPTPSDSGVTIAALNQMLWKISRLELMVDNPNAGRKGKLPAKLKTSAELDKSLKRHYEKGEFRSMLEISNQVLNAVDSTSSMLQIALQYRAEAKFKLQDFKGAAIDFSSYASLYPNLNKYPRVLLLAGDSYIYLRNSTVAKSFYQECVNSYPDAPEGKAAAGRLVSLASQGSSQSDQKSNRK